MTESYSVEATLEWKTNVPAILRQMLTGFEEVNRAVSGLKETLAELNTKSVAGIVRNLEKLKMPGAALEGLREMGSLTRDLEATQGTLAREARETAAAWKQMAEAARQVRPIGGGSGGGGGGRRSGGSHGWTHSDTADLGMGLQMAGDAGMGLAEKGFHAYAEVQLGTQLAQADRRVTDAVMAKANAVISQLQKQYPALTQAEGLTLFRNTMGIFGDADESLQALPGAARLQQLY